MRENLWEAQTSQALTRDFAPTDDCGLVEAPGVDVLSVSGARTNIKITTSDLAIAEKFLELIARRTARPTRFF